MPGPGRIVAPEFAVSRRDTQTSQRRKPHALSDQAVGQTIASALAPVMVKGNDAREARQYLQEVVYQR